MAADARLTTIREQILDQLVDLTENPKPEYWIDGQRVLWKDYTESLWARLDDVDRKIQEGDWRETPSIGYS